MQMPYISGRNTYDEACLLMAKYGQEAGLEASERAELARAQGNHINFCRYRQIERLLVILNLDIAIGTIH